MSDKISQKYIEKSKKIKNEETGRSTVIPKISKENMAYLITLAALCFSFSQWSNAKVWFQIILLLGGIAFGCFVIKSRNNK